MSTHPQPVTSIHDQLPLLDGGAFARQLLPGLAGTHGGVR